MEKKRLINIAKNISQERGTEKYFEFASNQDFPPAVLKLSECYLFGNGIEKNQDYAKELAKKAISLNAFGSKEFLKNNF